MPGNKVRMKMRQKHMTNLHAQILSIGQILLNVPLRINHNRAPARFISNHVRSMRQTPQIILLKKHAPDSRPSRRPPNDVILSKAKSPP